MATRTPSTVSTPAFHADEPEQSGDYRTLSGLAIISMVFGLVAPLALAGPLFLAIPLFGIAVSILALRRIAVSGGVLTGSWAAMIGMMLCIASSIAPTSRDLIFRAMRSNEAEKVARNWLEVLTSGDTESAFKLTTEGMRRHPLPEPGAPPPKTTPYQGFLEQPMIKALKAAGPNAEIRFVNTISYQAATYRYITVQQQFSVSPASGGQTLEVVVSVQRAQLPGESMSRWLVTRFEHFVDAKAIAESLASR